MSFAVPAVQQQQGTPGVQLHLQVAAVELQLQCWPNNACFFLMFLRNLLTLSSLLLLLCPQAMLFAALLLCAFVATGATRTGTPRKLAQITVAGPGDAKLHWASSQCVASVGNVCSGAAGLVSACCGGGNCQTFSKLTGMDHVIACSPGSVIACCPARAARG